MSLTSRNTFFSIVNRQCPISQFGPKGPLARKEWARHMAASGSRNNRRRRRSQSKARQRYNDKEWSHQLINSKHQTKNRIMFQSLGCPRNFVDTEVMLGTVLNHGMEITQNPKEADYCKF